MSKNNLEYGMRVLVPHADSQMKEGQFFLEAPRRRCSRMRRPGIGGYANTEAQALDARLQQASSCDGGAVYATAD